MQLVATVQDRENGPETAQKNERVFIEKPGSSVVRSLPKTHVRYWRTRVERRTYTYEGRTVEVPEYSVRMEFGGIRRRLTLGTAIKEDCCYEGSRHLPFARCEGLGCNDGRVVAEDRRPRSEKRHWPQPWESSLPRSICLHKSIPIKRLLRARRRPHDDFIHVHVRWFLDGIRHRSRNRVWFQRDLAKLFHHLPSAGIGDRVREFRFHHSR